MKPYSLLFAVCMLLSACGGSSSNDAGSAAAPPAQPPATSEGPSMDSFVTAVLNLFGSTDETSEPSSVDSFTATSPEDTEPMPVS